MESNKESSINTYAGDDYERPEDTNIFLIKLSELAKIKQVSPFILTDFKKDVFIQKAIELSDDSTEFSDEIGVD